MPQHFDRDRNQKRIAMPRYFDPDEKGNAMPLQSIRAVFMRGGTSKAIMFRSGDLPADRARWAPIFLAAWARPIQTGASSTAWAAACPRCRKFALSAAQP